MDFKVIHTRVPASSLIRGGAGTAGGGSFFASGTFATPREATIDLSPDGVARLEGSTPGRAEAIEGAAEEVSAVSTARPPRTDGEIVADSPGGPCSGSGGDEIGVFSGLLGVGGARTAVSVGWTPPCGAVGEVLGGPIRLGALDAMGPPCAGFGGI